MSIIYCEKHDRRWDSDRLEMCPVCENEPEKPDLLPKFYTPSQKCSQCGEYIEYIEANGCPERCGRLAKAPATPSATPIQPASRSQFKRMTVQGYVSERERKLQAMLLTVLDQVDYTDGACGLTEMVGAVLPKEVIVLAREALAAYEGEGK